MLVDHAIMLLEAAAATPEHETRAKLAARAWTLIERVARDAAGDRQLLGLAHRLLACWWFVDGMIEGERREAARVRDRARLN